MMNRKTLAHFVCELPFGRQQQRRSTHLWRRRMATKVRKIMLRPFMMILLAAMLAAFVLPFAEHADAQQFFADERVGDMIADAQQIFADERFGGEKEYRTGGRISPKYKKKYPVKFSNYESIVKVVAKPCMKNTKVLFLALSTPESFEQRKRIRDCWAGHKPKGVDVRFLVGAPKTTYEGNGTRWWEKPSAHGKNKMSIMNGLKREFRRMRDMMYTNVIDHYGYNVGVKLLSAFCWAAEQCSSAKYIVKIDEDSVINIPNLLFWIKHKFATQADASPGRLAIWGTTFQEDSSAIRNPHHKWFLPWEDWKPMHLPMYMNGPTYMLTIEAARRLCDVGKNSGEMRLARLEDVMLTGLLRVKGGISAHDAKMQFRSFGNLEHPEKCEKRHPIIISLTDAGEEKKYDETCKLLRSIKCPES